jgi:hypothetical protein
MHNHPKDTVQAARALSPHDAFIPTRSGEQPFSRPAFQSVTQAPSNAVPIPSYVIFALTSHLHVALDGVDDQGIDDMVFNLKAAESAPAL